MIDKILLAVDGSLNAQRAGDVSAELASKLNAELFIVHVLMHGRPSEELVRMAEVENLVKVAHATVSPGISYVTGSHPELLGGEKTDPRSSKIISAVGEQIVAKTKANCAEQGAKKIQTLVRAGDFGEEILNAAQELKVDMIVIGWRGLGILRRTVLGSVSHKVLNQAECSVVTVR